MHIFATTDPDPRANNVYSPIVLQQFNQVLTIIDKIGRDPKYCQANYNELHDYLVLAKEEISARLDCPPFLAFDTFANVTSYLHQLIPNLPFEIEWPNQKEEAMRFISSDFTRRLKLVQTGKAPKNSSFQLYYPTIEDVIDALPESYSKSSKKKAKTAKHAQDSDSEARSNKRKQPTSSSDWADAADSETSEDEKPELPKTKKEPQKPKEARRKLADNFENAEIKAKHVSPSPKPMRPSPRTTTETSSATNITPKNAPKSRTPSSKTTKSPSQGKVTPAALLPTTRTTKKK